MKAVILAGGKGTRLRPITHEIPKPLVPVKKKPIIGHIVDFLEKNNISDIAVVISKDHKEDFEIWLRNRNSPTQIILFIEDEPGGTFGSLRLVRGWVGNDDFILANGDSLIDINPGGLIDFHLNHKGVVTSCVMKANSSGDYFVPLISEDRVVSFSRKSLKPGAELIYSGFCVVKSDIFMYDDLSQNFLQLERDIFPKIMDEGLVFGYIVEQGRFYDCGTLESWEQAIREW